MSQKAKYVINVIFFWKKAIFRIPNVTFFQVLLIFYIPYIYGIYVLSSYRNCLKGERRTFTKNIFSFLHLVKTYSVLLKQNEQLNFSNCTRKL